MSRRIFKAIFLISVFICLVTMVVTAFVLFHFMEKRTQTELKEALELITPGVEEEGNDYLEDLEASHTDRRITWINADGRVLYDNQADAAHMDNHSSREEFQEAVSSGSGSSIRHSDTMMVETIYYAERLPDGTVLRMSSDQDSIWAIFMSLTEPAVVMFMFIVLLSLFLALRVSQSILKPLNELNLEHPENNDTYEELRPLLNKIRTQQDVIREQQRTEMERAEAFRLPSPQPLRRSKRALKAAARGRFPDPGSIRRPAHGQTSIRLAQGSPASPLRKSRLRDLRSSRSRRTRRPPSVRKLRRQAEAQRPRSGSPSGP